MKYGRYGEAPSGPASPQTGVDLVEAWRRMLPAELAEVPRHAFALLERLADVALLDARAFARRPRSRVAEP